MTTRKRYSPKFVPLRHWLTETPQAVRDGAVSVTSSWGEVQGFYTLSAQQSCWHRPFFNTRMLELDSYEDLSHICCLHSALSPTRRNLLSISCGYENTSNFLNSAAASCSFLLFSFCLTEACVDSGAPNVCWMIKNEAKNHKMLVQHTP